MTHGRTFNMLTHTLAATTRGGLCDVLSSLSKQAKRVLGRKDYTRGESHAPGRHLNELERREDHTTAIHSPSIKL